MDIRIRLIHLSINILILMKLADFVVVLLKKQLPIYILNAFRVDLSCYVLNPTNMTHSVILITIFFN